MSAFSWQNPFIHISNPRPILLPDVCVGHAVIVIKSLLQSTPAEAQIGTSSHPAKLVNRLCQQLPAIRNSNARACIFWLAGQYAPMSESDQGAKDSETHGYAGIALWAPDTLRLGAKGFAREVRPCHRQSTKKCDI